MSDEDLKKKFLDMPPEKQQRLYDAMAKVFSKLEADWKAKPENAGKPIKYTKLWEEHLKKTNEGGPP